MPGEDFVSSLVQVDHLTLDQIPMGDTAIVRELHRFLTDLGTTANDMYSGDDPVSGFNNRI